jgi:tricorn protease-like protein
MKKIVNLSLLAFLAVHSQAAIYLGTYQGELLAIDDQNYNVLSKIKLKTGIPREMVLMPDKKHILVMTNEYSGMEMVDLEKGEVVDYWKMDTPTTRLRPTSMAVDPTGRYVYTMTALYTKKPDRWDIGEEKLAVIDLTTHKVVREELFPKDKKAHAFGMKFRVSPDGKSLYLFGDSVLIFSTATLKLEKEISLEKPMYPGMARVNFVPEIDPHDSPDSVTALFQTEDPYVHRRIFGIGTFDLNTRKFTFDPIGTIVPGKNEDGQMSNVRLSEDRKTGYAVAYFGTLGDKTCQFWSFDITRKKLSAREDFTCNSRFYFSSNYDGKDLLIFGAGFEIYVYDAATLKLKKTVNLGYDVTMSGMIVLPSQASQVAAR